MCEPGNEPTAIDVSAEMEDDDFADDGKISWASQRQILRATLDSLMLDDPLDFAIMAAVNAKIKAQDEQVRINGAQATIKSFFFNSNSRQ